MSPTNLNDRAATDNRCPSLEVLLKKRGIAFFIREQGAIANMAELYLRRWVFMPQSPPCKLRSISLVKQWLDMKPLSASNTLIDAIKQQEQQLSAKAVDLDKFHKNEAVLLTDGPFKALNGIFLSYDGDQRAIILLEILNCPTKLTISPANLVAA